MFHAHIISFVTCFICILLHLFTFSWTNLLTRCLVPVSCFLLFFVSEKLHMKYSGIAWDENPRQYFPVTYTDTEGETEGSCGAPTPPGGAPRHASWWCGAHRAPPGSGLRPYKPLHPKTLNTRSLFHEKLCRHFRHQP